MSLADCPMPLITTFEIQGQSTQIFDQIQSFQRDGKS